MLITKNEYNIGSNDNPKQLPYLPHGVPYKN
jgi:hypothetical protein